MPSLSTVQIHLAAQFLMANTHIPSAATPGGARTEVGTINSHGWSSNAMVEPWLNTRKGKCLKDSEARGGGNVLRTYAPRTLKYGSKTLVNSSDFTADLMICRFLSAFCMLSCLTRTPLSSRWPKVYASVFFPQLKKKLKKSSPHY